MADVTDIAPQSGPLLHVAGWLHALANAIEARQTRKALAQLPDTLLRDIGVERPELRKSPMDMLVLTALRHHV